jgi:hypothetical protein
VIETAIPNVDQDQLFRRIEEEFAAHGEKLRFPPDDDSRLAQLSQLQMTPLRLTLPFAPDENKGYHVNDLLRYNASELIRNAYIAILGRKPDKDSQDHWMEQLASGRVSKIDLIGRLRYAPEGRESGVPIRGLWMRFALSQMGQRIPVLGYVLKIGLCVMRLPHLQSGLRRLEFNLVTELTVIKRHFNRLVNRFNRLVAMQSSTAASLDAEELQAQMAALDKQITGFQHCLSELTDIRKQMGLEE